MEMQVIICHDTWARGNSLIWAWGSEVREISVGGISTKLRRHLVFGFLVNGKVD